jgi:nicotinamidase-related amidase
MDDDWNEVQTPAQLLLCVDLQKAQLTATGLSAFVEVDAVLAACRSVLDAWRSRMWPVAHLRRVAQATWFDPASDATDWLDGWRPQPAEMLFEHPLPSAYSSPRFAEYMRHIGPATCTLIGFALEETVLATVIEGFHRGHQFRLITEALACRGSKVCELTAYRGVLTGLAQNYALIQPLQSLLPTVRQEAC